MNDAIQMLKSFFEALKGPLGAAILVAAALLYQNTLYLQAIRDNTNNLIKTIEDNSPKQAVGDLRRDFAAVCAQCMGFRK